MSTIAFPVLVDKLKKHQDALRRFLVMCTTYYFNTPPLQTPEYTTTGTHTGPGVVVMAVTPTENDPDVAWTNAYLNNLKNIEFCGPQAINVLLGILESVRALNRHSLYLSSCVQEMEKSHFDLLSVTLPSPQSKAIEMSEFMTIDSGGYISSLFRWEGDELQGESHPMPESPVTHVARWSKFSIERLKLWEEIQNAFDSTYNMLVLLIKATHDVDKMPEVLKLSPILCMNDLDRLSNLITIFMDHCQALSKWHYKVRKDCQNFYTIHIREVEKSWNCHGFEFPPLFEQPCISGRASVVRKWVRKKAFADFESDESDYESDHDEEYNDDDIGHFYDRLGIPILSNDPVPVKTPVESPDSDKENEDPQKAHESKLVLLDELRTWPGVISHVLRVQSQKRLEQKREEEKKEKERVMADPVRAMIYSVMDRHPSGVDDESYTIRKRIKKLKKEAVEATQEEKETLRRIRDLSHHLYKKEQSPIEYSIVDYPRPKPPMTVVSETQKPPPKPHPLRTSTQKDSITRPEVCLNASFVDGLGPVFNLSNPLIFDPLSTGFPYYYQPIRHPCRANNYPYPKPRWTVDPRPVPVSETIPDEFTGPGLSVSTCGHDWGTSSLLNEPEEQVD